MNKNNSYVEDESTVMQFIHDFFSTYDKNRHMLHTLFPADGTFIVLGNRISGHADIQRAMCTMANTTHNVLSIDIHHLSMALAKDVSMYQVLCAGTVEFGGDPQYHGFTATLLVCFQKPNILNVVSFDERCQWPKLS